MCHIHHTRRPADQGPTHNPRSFPLNSSVLWGRYLLVRLASEDQQHVEVLLTQSGNDERDIMDWGIGNCQDWVAAADGMLEREVVQNVGEGPL